MAKKSSYKSTSGTGTGGMIPTSSDPTGPKPGVGGPTVGTEDPIRPYGGPGTTGTSSPVDYTGNIGQYGSYGPSTTNMFGAPSSSAKNIIYRDVMANTNISQNANYEAQSAEEASQMQQLAGSQSDQARQEVLKRMGINIAGNASFDPRRPQTGGLFGVAFSKTTDSKTTF